MSLPSALPPELWMNRPGVPELMAVLDADKATSRLVGGAVRDMLLDQPVTDIDIATRMPPEKVMASLAEAGIKAVPTGLRHGTVTAIVRGNPYEITTLRRDVETFGRHANVVFTDDWQEDAARRDFTINALYADPLSGVIHDYFRGRADLEVRCVRFIGDPLQRIAEDHLRILRFFRFSARFSTTLEPDGLRACAARAADLMALSRERIREELLRLLALPSPAPTVAAMIEHGIFTPILPEIREDAAQRLASLIAAEQEAQVPGHPLRRLASLLPEEPETADAVARRLKLSNVDRRRLVAAATPVHAPSDPRVLAYRIGGEAALDRMLLHHDPRAAQWHRALAEWRSPRMPLSGKDLIAMGVPPGPDVSRLLAEIENRWLDGGLSGDPARVQSMAREVLGIR